MNATAGQELIDRQEADERGEDEEACKPVILFSNTTRAAFQAWIETNDDDEFRFWDYEPFNAKSGRVVLYFFPTAVQALAVSKIITKIRSELVRIGNDEELSETLLTLPSPTLRFGIHLRLPDGALEPRDAFFKGLPNVVVHSAYTETWSHLEEKLRSYMTPTTTVQVAIGIKMFRSEKRIMIFRRIDDDNFYEDEVDLTTTEPGCISISVEALYHGVAIPTALVGHEAEEVKVDLKWLRNIIDTFERSL
ncbi:hypothetical protein P3T76_011619 [Phytophthora citrophthora]|uniref:Uncharacterized protein n=1 Tax=Phytophthora citrophthora TaxID=4793 RepID=A0AAD9G8I1_9STRA|nr:hypothetical protein P3T76_011619 [Phytophthora citrophthora]